MNLLKLTWSYLKAKPLNTSLSIVLVALGIGLSSLLMQLNHQIQGALYRNIEDINLVVGAKGSPLQMILSYVYHIDLPTGNIPLEEAKLLMRKNRYIAKSIPLALGDSYQGHRIVGTTLEYAQHYKAELAQGKWWQKDMEAVVGSRAAKKAKLRVGDLIHGAHGLTGQGTHVHETMPYKIVGIMEPSGTVLDQLILTNVASVWRVHEGHDHEESMDVSFSSDTAKTEEHNHDHAHDHDHDHDHDHAHEHKPVNLDSLPPISEEGQSITALLLTYGKDSTGNTSAMATTVIPDLIEDNTKNLGIAMPARELQRLMDNMGTGYQLLGTLTWLILFISAFSMFISLYTSLKERRYELALMRVMGASRVKIMSLILLEGFWVAFIGALLGWLLSHLGLWIFAGYVSENYQYELSAWLLLPSEGMLMIGAGLIGLLAAALPAYQAYRTDISHTLKA